MIRLLDVGLIIWAAFAALLFFLAASGLAFQAMRVFFVLFD